MKTFEVKTVANVTHWYGEGIRTFARKTPWFGEDYGWKEPYAKIEMSDTATGINWSGYMTKSEWNSLQ